MRTYYTIATEYECKDLSQYLLVPNAMSNIYGGGDVIETLDSASGYFAPHKVGRYFTVFKGSLDMYIEEPIFYA